MLKKLIPEQVGPYMVTPLTHTQSDGQYGASVSIRRGVYDRVFRFIPQFANEVQAARYALTEGIRMVRCNQLN